MTICMKCGDRWEFRDGSAEERKYSMCEDCIKEAREKGEIPPKPESDGTSLSYSEAYGLVSKRS